MRFATTLARLALMGLAAASLIVGASAAATAGCAIRPAWTLSPRARFGSALSAPGKPLSASARVKGSVALFSATAEVRATAPGLLVTQ